MRTVTDRIGRWFLLAWLLTILLCTRQGWRAMADWPEEED